MQAASSAPPRRTFARANGAGGTAVPRLVAAEERHRKNLQQIQLLKQALCSTVGHAPVPSASATAPPQRDWSMPSASASSVAPAPGPSWMATSPTGSTGVVATPSQASWTTQPPSWTPASAAALRESQEEVESLVRERNKLQRRCVELASLLGEASQRVPASRADGGPLSAPSTEGPGAWSPVHDAALAVVEQVTRCYPGAVRVWGDGHSDSPAAGAPIRPRSAAGAPAQTVGSRTGALSAASPGAGAGTQLTTEELCGALHQLVAFLPRLASMTAVSELVAASGPELLHHIHALEAEKQSDCVAVLSITDHLTAVAAQLRQEAAEKDEALGALRDAVEELMAEKAQWARRARASEEALATRYEEYRQREKAWEKEVAGLLESRQDSQSVAAPASSTVVAATAAMEPLQAQITQLERELDAKLTALEELQAAHAELQAQSAEMEAAQQHRIEVLEGQLHPLELELQSQSRIIESTLHKVEGLSRTHHAETAALVDAHSGEQAERDAALLSLREAKARLELELAERTASAAQATAALEAASAELASVRAAHLPGAFALVEAAVQLQRTHSEDNSVSTPSKLDAMEGEEGDGDQSGESPFQSVDVRRLQQSLKRMSRERAALKRKLEHRGGALTEMEGELEAAQRLVAQRDSQLQAMEAELRAATAAPAPLVPEAAAVAPGAVAGPPFRWLDFVELERDEAVASLYPEPVDVSAWLLRSTGVAASRFADYAQDQLDDEEQLRVAAVGPLYHVGYTLLLVEGLVPVPSAGGPSAFPLIWRRFLLQLQRVLDVQLAATALSPPDTAKYFYTLACHAGLLGAAATPRRDPLVTYSYVVAALCACLGDFSLAGDDEAMAVAESGPSSAQAALAAGKWRTCQTILHHVCKLDDGGGSSEADAGAASPSPVQLFSALCNAARHAGGAEETAEGAAGAGAGGCLASLLSHGLLSDHLTVAHCALSAAAVTVVAPHGHVTQGELSPDARPSYEPQTDPRALAVLLLYLARHEYLLGGWVCGDATPAAAGLVPVSDAPWVTQCWGAPAQHSRVAPSASAGGAAPSTAAVSATRLLAFLSAEVLPVVLTAVRRCAALEEDASLLTDFCEVRRQLLARRSATAPDGVPCAPGELVPGVPLLSEAQVRALAVPGAAAPHPTAVSAADDVVRVPVAEYERLQRELLALYETNDTYHRYIQELLSAAEAT